MNPANLGPNNDRVIIRAVSRRQAYCCPQIFAGEIIADNSAWQHKKTEKSYTKYS
jgi:hypothetical protein